MINLHSNIRMFLSSILLFLIHTTLVMSQAPDTIWTKTFGGSNIDIGQCVKETSDGGFIITGYTRSYGTMSGRNLLFLRTDSFGNLIWVNGYGGNNDEEGNSVIQTTDGGFVSCGYTKSYGSGGNDVYLIKVDANGNQLWDRVFGGTSDEEAYSMVLTNDGGFLIASATSSFGAGSRDIWLIKTDATGNQQWTKTIGGLSSDGARSINKTSDGGYIITGWTLSYGPGAIGNVWLVKTDSLGNMQWNKFFGGTDVDRGLSVQQTNDGGYILTGYTASSGAGLDDMLLIKTDSAGNTQWQNTFGGSGRDYGNSVVQSSDGGYVVTGYTLSYGAGGDDLWIVKTDEQGSMLWSKTLGGAQSDVGNFIIESSDGSYVITGHTLSSGAGLHDVWLIKLAAIIPVELGSLTAEVNGNNVLIKWITASETNNSGFELQKSKKSEVKSQKWNSVAFIKGRGTSTEINSYEFVDHNLEPGNYSYRLKQIDYDGNYTFSNIIDVEIFQPTEFRLEQNYPNPFNPGTIISWQSPIASWQTIKLYDIMGREIETIVDGYYEAGSHSALYIANSTLPTGVYFYRLKAGNFSESKKMILIR
ncbi:T9SS type A sorting domain-containing protein [Ignavibacterium album]|uniref:T9SS type A sorting domain-containing protein n=1 Tax=Ignavibacterium album TaxID=591197 RepID=UPI0035BA2735